MRMSNKMNLANFFTISRIILAPAFFVCAFLPQLAGVPRSLVFPILVGLFLYIEASDLIDGYIARRTNQITDIGKVLDPFSDIICRVSYFLLFTVIGIMPPLSFLIILYREFGSVFLRMVLTKEKVFLAARISGKIKSLCYSAVSILSLVFMYLRWINPETAPAASAGQDSLKIFIQACFFAAAGLSLFSLVDYLLVFRRHILSGDDSQ